MEQNEVEMSLSDLSKKIYHKSNEGISQKLLLRYLQCGAEWQRKKLKIDLTHLRNNLYESIPDGSVPAFDLIGLISDHLQAFDKLIKTL